MQDAPFNNLSPAEAERLAMLAEEAAEVIQVVGKVLRHGYSSHHPDDPNETPNQRLLEQEILDFRAVCEMMVAQWDILPPSDRAIESRTAQKKIYTHHQG